MLQKAFNSYAEQYDDHFTLSEVGKLQRSRVWKFLDKYLSGTKKILELNCGTGYDAQWLASKGHQVLATDISEGMIEVAKKRATGGNPDFIVCDAKNISSLNTTKLDIIFSNFGGLNCLDAKSLEKLADDLSLVATKDSYICAVIMGKNCSWENFYFKRIKSDLHGRRNKGMQNANINGDTFPVWYYTPEEFASRFSKHFTAVEVKPVGLFIPPSYLNYYFSKKPLVLSALNAGEKLFGNSARMAKFSDHYFIALKKK